MESEIDVIALALVAGGIASITQWFLAMVVVPLGVKITKAMNQILSIALAVLAGIVYMAVYGGIELGSDTDWASTIAIVYAAGQLSYQFIVTRLGKPTTSG